MFRGVAKNERDQSSLRKPSRILRLVMETPTGGSISRPRDWFARDPYNVDRTLVRIIFVDERIAGRRQS